MKKNILNETFYIKEKIPSILKIDLNFLNNHFLNCIKKENKIIFEDYNYNHFNNYYKINFHQQLQWIGDYILELFRLDYKKTLSGTSISLFPYIGCIVKNNDFTDFHNFLYNTDISYSCIFNLNEENQSVMFKYKNDLLENKFIEEEISKGEFLLFNSHINFKVENTNNDKKSLLLILLFEEARNNY